MTGGDISDTGHAEAEMVTDVHSEIADEDRWFFKTLITEK